MILLCTLFAFPRLGVLLHVGADRMPDGKAVNKQLQEGVRVWQIRSLGLLFRLLLLAFLFGQLWRLIFVQSEYLQKQNHLEFGPAEVSLFSFPFFINRVMEVRRTREF